MFAQEVLEKTWDGKALSFLSEGKKERFNLPVPYVQYQQYWRRS
jgi:hypothetical protein